MKYHVRGDIGLYQFLGNTLSRLPSGSSALFLVARADLADRDIYVPFLYEDEWDNRQAMYADPKFAGPNPSVGDPHLEHYVYFESYSCQE
jgi:hypothetical protein